MSKTIMVASMTPMAIRIQEPIPEGADPATMPPLRTAVLNGANHTETFSGMGITRGVDADLFQKWHDAMEKAGSPLASAVREISEDELSKPLSEQFGFEPGLKKLTESAEQKELAAKGSTQQSEGPVAANEMAATSDTPNDDSPRGQPDVVNTAHTQTPATALIDPEHKD